LQDVCQESQQADAGEETKASTRNTITREIIANRVWILMVFSSYWPSIQNAVTLIVPPFFRDARVF